MNAVLAQVRGAVGRQAWTKVRELGTRAAQLRRSVDDGQAALAAADAVYGAPAVVLDPLSPGIIISSPRWTTPEQARQQVSAMLAELMRDDAALSQFYAARQRTISALSVPGAIGTTSATAGGDVQQQALEALGRGDIAAVNVLAEAMLGKVTGVTAADSAGSTAARLIAPSVLPEACLPRAKALGLEPADIPELAADLRGAVAEFVEQYALGASAAVHDRATDGVTRLKVVAEKITIPSDVAAIFAETIALFALHIYVNSAGIRYVPLPTEREPLLIEAHPDGDDAATPLLRELHLEQRRGVARNQIEARLRANGPRILANHLGLDPFAFRLVCVPPDLYMRLGGLRALVGGNARYGGLLDLCSINRDDARENTVVRFAVIRRERLGVRFGVAESTTMTESAA